jgi:hypothetical protein
MDEKLDTVIKSLQQLIESLQVGGRPLPDRQFQQTALIALHVCLTLLKEMRYNGH